MRGNWFCPPTWPWPDPLRRRFQPGLPQLILSLLWLGAAVLLAQQPSASTQLVGVASGDLAARTRQLLIVAYPSD